MLKHEITYEDFNGNKVTETLYFNLTMSEIVELNVSYQGGLEETITKMVKTEDTKGLFGEFKKFLLSAYGVKSEDGKRFIKNDQIREEFSQTAAFDEIFMKMTTDDTFAANFIKGIVPKNFEAEIEKLERQEKVQNVMLPPVPGEVVKE